MRNFYGYVRVSTARQGERGVSLTEQRAAIEQYAHRNGIRIVEWFEELETAARAGRQVFARMMRALEAHKADGVVLHKIDRGARNLRDWTDLSALVDRGLEVRFTADNLDLASRGGRLAADIQAVVAADYVRNLREEIKKGFYGRLKQGVFPLPAPVGYQNRGKGMPKTIDPIHGPIVRKAFELYATGRYTQLEVLAAVTELGLRNRRGRPLDPSAFSFVMRNPFYFGIIRLRNTGETFAGAHEPLIGRVLFENVQDLLAGRKPKRRVIKEHRFSRLFSCATCGYSVVAEARKGHVYYRCHTTTCRGVSAREERIDSAIHLALAEATLTQEDRDCLLDAIESMATEWQTAAGHARKGLEIEIAGHRERLGRLTDAVVDGTIDKASYEDRKADVLLKLTSAQERLTATKGHAAAFAHQAKSHFERTQAALLLYETGDLADQRETVLMATSDRKIVGKNVEITLSPGFVALANLSKIVNGGPYPKQARMAPDVARNAVLEMMGIPSCPTAGDAGSTSSTPSALP